MREYSRAACKGLTEPSEEFVPYPYDDLVTLGGAGHYPEYTFEAPPRGTITVGFGHTDAAGGLKIARGMRLTLAQAEDLLLVDMTPCVRAVNRLLKVEVTQHQFDMLCDAYFNCPAAAIAAIKLFNTGQAEAVPAKLLQYVSARDKHTGELVRLRGLVNRRNAEVAWGNTPDESEPPPAPNPDVVFSPKAERNDPPKSILRSKTAAAGGALTSLSLAEAGNAFNEVLDPIKQAKGSLEELGLFQHLGALAHDPKLFLAMAIAGAVLGIFVVLDRRFKLVNDHV